MILVRYVLKELVGPFLAALFGITFLFVVDFLVKILDNVLSKGLPASTVLEIFVLNLAWMLSLSIPMAVLVASLMAFGRLSGDQEITACKAAGISPLSLMRPVLIVAMLVSVLMVCFNNWVLPEANHRSVELMNAVSRKKPHAFIDAGRLITQFPDVQLWVNRIDPVSGSLYGVQIYEMEKKGAPRIIYADSASMEYADNGATLMLRLKSGETHMTDADNPENYFRIRFFSQELAMKNVDDRLERRSRSYRSDREMPIEMMMDVVTDAEKKYGEALDQAVPRRLATLVTLQKQLEGDSIAPKLKGDSDVSPMDSIQRRRSLQRLRIQEIAALRTTERLYGRMDSEKKRAAQYRVEIHKKYSTGFACFVFILIGAPLGIMARKGGIGTGILYSLAFFVIYWICLIGGENMADRLIVSPVLAMWMSNIIIGVFGIFITIAMVRDRFSGDSKFFRGLRAVKGFFGKIFKKLTRRFG
ncbi:MULTISPECIES: LptF/LptG family permease [unclassified Fibrobacter]|uniref:LptF/LptG family permease n=1 Tax=unclassified Fibrobacter TaxID=2634177 RepID=UPI000D6C2F56|nr:MULTISPECIES: LptF/LptG family permease [unclassified Fibrobacter]PWJ66207.1 lipopolysaccharide export system permease protein [Fibrobacter sp. UWR4]PZW69411.1 lipopolysaccharide export system permease protein [Fibrobacter sp. UWR1]